MTANSTTYIAPSGALVFAAGSICFDNCLDTYRLNIQAGGVPVEISPMQTFMANIMGALKGPVYSNIGGH